MPFNVSAVDKNGRSVLVHAAAYTSELGGIVADLSGALKRGVLLSIVIKDWSGEDEEKQDEKQEDYAIRAGDWVIRTGPDAESWGGGSVRKGNTYSVEKVEPWGGVALVDIPGGSFWGIHQFEKVI